MQISCQYNFNRSWKFVTSK